MKTTLLFLSVFLTTSLFGQNVYIPDANFKAYLVGNPEINTNGDTEIQVSEASAFDGLIYCTSITSESISDLTGLEYFNSFTNLYLSGNQLTEIDLSNNISLEEAYIVEHNLVNITLNDELIHLTLYANSLDAIDLSNNINLTYLDFGGSQLIEIDLSNNTNLTHLTCLPCTMTNIELSNNIELTNLTLGMENLISLDLSNNSDLKHLELAGVSQLNDLDLSNNFALEQIIWPHIPLPSIDLTNNFALIGINFNFNQLTNLDLSNNNSLETLVANNGTLNSLNLNNAYSLFRLYCMDNQLECLNLKNVNTESTMNLELYVSGNPNLTCIEVSDSLFASQNWILPFGGIDPQMYFSEDCNNACSASTVGLTELTTSKNLIQILDMMGRETTFKPNTPLIYVYDDGSMENVFSVEY